MPFQRLPLEFVAQFPPKLPRVFRPYQHPEARLLRLGSGPPLIFHTPEPDESLEKLFAECRLQPGIVFPFRRPFAAGQSLPPAPVAKTAPLLLALAQFNATPHKIAPFRGHRQVLAPGAGWCPAKRTVLLIDHRILGFSRRVQRLSHRLENASLIRRFSTSLSSTTLSTTRGR